MKETPQEVKEMLPCPFCGGEPEIKQTGKNELKLKCKRCVFGTTQSVLYESLGWLKDRMIEDWNKRVVQSSLPTYFGNHGAAIAALSDLVKSLIEEVNQLKSEINLPEGYGFQIRKL